MSIQIEADFVRFSYQSDEGAFAVGRAIGGEGEFILVGPIAHLLPGQHLMLSGAWAFHPSFGRQFKVERVLVDNPKTKRGLELYLSNSGIKGLGPTNAKRIVEHFGLHTLNVLEEEASRLTEVKGIGKKRSAQIAQQWQRDQTFREIRAEIRGLGLGPTITHRLIERYGEDALAILRREPYRLSSEIQGIGFKTADRVALSNGLSPNSPERAQAGVSFTLSSAEAEGHCYLPREELTKRAQKLGITSDCVEDAIEDMLSDRRLFEPTPSDQKIYRPQLGYIEKRIAKRLKRLCQSPPAKGSLFQQTIDVDSLQEDLNLTLNAEQKTAVDMALNNSVSIITGGPGTGKTTIIRALMTAASMRAENWQLAAPTGRAAKRMTEATGCEAKTIHRLLSYNGHSRKFSNNEESPLAAHAIIIDEASMLDLWLMDALLSAIQSGCRLILVGDIDQLPSVGPGRILSDLIYSKALPVVRLQDVYRQAQNSNIVRNAHRVNKGLPPISCEKDIDASDQKDFYVLYREEQPNAQDSIIEVVAKRLPKMGFHPLRDIQVLTPMHSGILGTTALNIRLQSELNPGGKSYKTRTKEFRVGDRVLQLKNDYENEIYNGDIGFVISIDEHGMIVKFDDRPILLSGSSIANLELAYAVSIHKSQGSEYPAVVTLLHNAHRIMLRRNLLYTAMTRAKEFCCIVGSSWAISFASKENTGGERWTSLQQYLEKMDEGNQ